MEDECIYLMAGYEQFKGDERVWSKILNKYKEKFHPQRTSVDIKDKKRTIDKGLNSNKLDIKLKNEYYVNEARKLLLK